MSNISTVNTTSEVQTITPQERSAVIKLKAKKAEESPSKGVKWTEDTEDNEFKKMRTSKKCCIFHKKRRFDESDSDESDSEDEEHHHDCEHHKEHKSL
ncbi:ppp1r11 [Acrasis kona]|uniref:Ppp1r11 n=1 Tax=Acrasis kona TaxID=1008807 RepID=A0AAW2ZBT7_9EUKA